MKKSKEEPAGNRKREPEDRKKEPGRASKKPKEKPRTRVKEV
jgi:hypothetical protein